MAELEAEMRITDGQKRASWRKVFKYGPEGRKAYLVAALQAFQQASGINFITGYGVVFFFSVGVGNPFFHHYYVKLHRISRPLAFTDTG